MTTLGPSCHSAGWRRACAGLIDDAVEGARYPAASSALGSARPRRGARGSRASSKLWHVFACSMPWLIVPTGYLRLRCCLLPPVRANWRGATSPRRDGRESSAFNSVGSRTRACPTALYRLYDVGGRRCLHPRPAGLSALVSIRGGRRSVMALLRMNEVTGMDPITLIVTALAAGAALGVQDTASAMVKDAYASLKALVRRGWAVGRARSWCSPGMSRPRKPGRRRSWRSWPRPGQTVTVT